MTKHIGGELVVKCLEALDVKYVFGIPGAKIDSVFNALNNSSIQLIICRHEQNAAFMAGIYGRLTGKPGVVLVTSGPGVSNLTTGLLTATTEGDPIVALGGNVPRAMALKASHQSADNVGLMKPATKSSAQVEVVSAIPEVIANAFRLATMPRKGACFVSFPQDVLLEKTDAPVIQLLPAGGCKVAHQTRLAEAASFINEAKFPVLLLGEEASQQNNVPAIRALLEKTALPTVGTFQAAGVVSRELVSCFAGRVGLFRNQPGDQLLKKADVVITVGFNPVEYDPETWNPERQKTIIHLDYVSADIRESYQPKLELLGDIHLNVIALTSLLQSDRAAQNKQHAKPFYDMHQKIIDSTHVSKEGLVHPLHFIQVLRELIDDDVYVTCDIGSVYMWMARYFLCYEPRHLLFSNGQQTLGVALPWAMGVNFACPGKRVVSLSGDGGFLFSAMELENAVRQKNNFVHFVWRDGSYNMVKEQEVMKYKREAGVEFGKVNLVDFANAFGAKGYELKNPADLKSMMQKAFAQKGPVLVDIPIDYSDNVSLFQIVKSDTGN